ncbi:MAG: hypothetical protein AAGE76_12815 [Pseudomonadota bacterium]
MARIIILEDDEDLSPLLQASLADAGHAVDLETTADEAVAFYERNLA